ncbi:hypothetical protein JKF63_00679 [Porcisia hertigi]|uniref:Golgi SNAP receptor complex member 1 n=1 Tax=Porcisia hertigi TaxID=2761500 RepID=A0A836HDJ1_9TRYP|nr:hypothetical protein JKF63_00679 [Porcisia hertigi]
MGPEARQVATWERLRNEARQTDQLIDQQLRTLEVVAHFDDDNMTDRAGTSFSLKGAGTSSSVTPVVPSTNPTFPHHSTANPPSASTRTLEEVERQYHAADGDVGELLRRLELTVMSMEEACSEFGPTSAAARHTDRFRGVLAEKQQARRRLALVYRQRKERYELAASRLSGAARRHVGSADDDTSGGVRILMDEQAAIQHTLNRVNGLLEQAGGTRNRLLLQRERFNDIGDKLLHIAERIPFLQNVLHRIDVHRRRETVVLGTVMSSLLFIFFFFL